MMMTSWERSRNTHSLLSPSPKGLHNVPPPQANFPPVLDHVLVIELKPTDLAHLPVSEIAAPKKIQQSLFTYCSIPLSSPHYCASEALNVSSGLDSED